MHSVFLLLPGYALGNRLILIGVLLLAGSTEFVLAVLVTLSQLFCQADKT
jgi:hypothetical protein